MRKNLTMAQRNERNLYTFILPGIIGFLAFSVFPIIYAIVLSFFKSDGITSKFIGLDNYIKMFNNALYWKSVDNTLYMVVLGVPFNLLIALGLALLLHNATKGSSIFKVVYYIPTILPGVALSILLMNLFQTKSGLLNSVLRMLGAPDIDWLGNPALTKLTFVIMGGWSVGSLMIFFLVGLEGVPITYYEAAKIDGANAFQQFKNITIPQLTPSILYNMILSIVWQMQAFTPAFVMTQGGPDKATYFYVYKLWKDAFQDLKMGYASAEGIILFVISLIFTVLILKSSQFWVHYEGGNNE